MARSRGGGQWTTRADYLCEFSFLRTRILVSLPVRSRICPNFVHFTHETWGKCANLPSIDHVILSELVITHKLCELFPIDRHLQRINLRNSLDVGALVADLLLHHLEPARAELPRDHLLPAVALPRPLGRLHHRLVVGQLDKVAHVELLKADLRHKFSRKIFLLDSI